MGTVWTVGASFRQSSLPRRQSLRHLRFQILERLACQLPWVSAWPSAADRQVAGPADWRVVELGLFRRGRRRNRDSPFWIRYPNQVLPSTGQIPALDRKSTRLNSSHLV